MIPEDQGKTSRGEEKPFNDMESTIGPGKKCGARFGRLHAAVVLTALALVSIAAALLTSGCKGETYYTLEIDVRSFVPEEERSRSWSVEDPSGDRIILIPYSGTFLRKDEDIPEDAQGGLRLELPVSADDDSDIDIVLTLEVDVDMTREISSSSFDRARIRLFLAPGDAQNVYTDDRAVLTVEITDIEEEKQKLAGTRTLRRGDPGYDILASGAFRTGMDGLFQADADLEVGYIFNALRVSISARPFSFLP